MKSEMLTPAQFRTVCDYLWDCNSGGPAVVHVLGQIEQFKDSHRMLLWLCRNKIRGQELLDFFKDEAGDENARGVLLGVQKIQDRLEGRKFTSEGLTLEDLK